MNSVLPPDDNPAARQGKVADFCSRRARRLSSGRRAGKAPAVRQSWGRRAPARRGRRLRHARAGRQSGGTEGMRTWTACSRRMTIRRRGRGRSRAFARDEHVACYRGCMRAGRPRRGRRALFSEQLAGRSPAQRSTMRRSNRGTKRALRQGHRGACRPAPDRQGKEREYGKWMGDGFGEHHACWP
jgi:hypothetical protein